MDGHALLRQVAIHRYALFHNSDIAERMLGIVQSLRNDMRSISNDGSCCLEFSDYLDMAETRLNSIITRCERCQNITAFHPS